MKFTLSGGFVHCSACMADMESVFITVRCVLVVNVRAFIQVNAALMANTSV